MASKLRLLMPPILTAILSGIDRASTYNSSSLLPPNEDISTVFDLPPLNVSSPGNAQLIVRCSGSHFGFQPNVADCESAKGYIVPDADQQTFGQRDTGLEDVTPLPFRVMGGRLVVTVSVIESDAYQVMFRPRAMLLPADPGRTKSTDRSSKPWRDPKSCERADLTMRGQW